MGCHSDERSSITAPVCLGDREHPYPWGMGISSHAYTGGDRHRDQTVSHHLSPSRRDRHKTLFLVTVNNRIKKDSITSLWMNRFWDARREEKSVTTVRFD